MLCNARHTAKRTGVPFNLKITDIVIPKNCPILGIPLFPRRGQGRGGSDNSPSLDKIIPALGYVPGNIVVVSSRANRLKSDATIEELRDIASFYATLRGTLRSPGKS